MRKMDNENDYSDLEEDPPEEIKADTVLAEMPPMPHRMRSN